MNDPEYTLQSEDGGASPSRFDVLYMWTVVTACFACAVIWSACVALFQSLLSLPSLPSSFVRWLRCQRVCAWCNTRLSGNPLAQATHTICPACSARALSSLSPGQGDDAGHSVMLNSPSHLGSSPTRITAGGSDRLPVSATL